MTLSASYDPQRKIIRVIASYGTITVQVDEALEHTRQFWSSLGRMIELADQQAQVESAQAQEDFQ